MEKHIFSMSSTNACKGFALLLLLWCHLFHELPEYGYIVYSVAILSKVCVAIFIILSGYGYSESIKSRTIDLFSFYQKRLIAIYSNYWFIAIIFVPIGVFFMNRTLDDAFTNHPYIKFAIQMTGLHRYFYDEHGYNATWWYMSLIIPLIIFFPFIYDLTKKYGLFYLLFCFAILIPKKEYIPLLNDWLLPFAMGIYASQRNYMVSMDSYLRKFGRWKFAILIMCLAVVAIFRTYGPILNGVKIDWLFGGLIILFIFELTKSVKTVEGIFAFLGKHLFNIFLFHTFIYCYYWKDFIYSFHYPLLIFFVFLIICIIISIIIEGLKRLLFFGKLTLIIQELNLPFKTEIMLQQDAPIHADNSRS